MFIKNPDGSLYDDAECTYDNSVVSFRIYPENYSKLANLAYKNKIMTFDIGRIINLVIENYPEELDLK